MRNSWGSLSVRTVEVHPVKVCRTEVRLTQLCAAQVRPAEVGPLKVRAAEVRPAKIRAAEVYAAPTMFYSPRVPLLDPSLQGRQVFRIRHRLPSGPAAPLQDR